MKQLIVTADDFGVFPSINQGVKEAILKGKVNSVACLSNHVDSVKNIKELIEETNGAADIGCHLTITSGKPLLLKNNEVFTFGDYFKPCCELSFNQIEQLLPELKTELIAQVENLKDSGIPVKHLSCHHSSLTFTQALFKVYLDVAAHFKIPMRSVNITPNEKDSNYRKALSLMLFDDVPLKKIREMRSFGKVITEFLQSYETKITTPNLLESRHYGPIPMIDVWEVSLPRRVKKKHEDLNKFLTDFIGQDSKNAELMLHLIKDDIYLREQDDEIDYPGIDKKYFDSRRIEFESITQFDFNTYSDIKLGSWTEIN